MLRVSSNAANNQPLDLALQTRIVNSIIDRGTYEYQGAASVFGLAMNGDNGVFTTSINTTTPLIISCRAIGQIFSTSTSPVNGSLTAKTWVDNAPTIFYNRQSFVKHYYELTPVMNAGTATARITLYATQQEFSDFNAVSATNIPAGPADVVGKANLRIIKFSGQSSDGSGAPGSYAQPGTIINPNDNDIIWNSSLSRWEIIFGDGSALKAVT